ncbi:tannase/feruloyl esterase family alpha/beta hydrolase [Trebonia sp.]|uniref:tannase/feruloyl esterase family alpha/beta hydrolase n=1 Tax=Trebonia sp. TaxID=2767075 RepID=UPI0026034CD6|nr:tannase/feruloyl esterase family alpha/beta hydrolase [Trebonia sp.]
MPTLSGQDDSDMANLAVIPARMSCSQLAKTTKVNGQSIHIVEYQTASASPGSPKYCAITGHINTYIGFEILLPISTWRQRYLQVGCGGLCGSISIAPDETTGYKPLADGYFVLAAEDDGHNGNGTSWYGNPQQRVDFAYLSYHDVALVSKGLAEKFYGIGPRYSYFDGCSQGGHEALGEIQRYPTDFNGVLAGAPASIMTELNSVLHEYTFEANYTKADYSGSTILDQPEADIVLNAALKACYPKVGLMLDYRACEQKFNLNSVKCSATLKTNCLTAAQIAVVRKVQDGPVDSQGQLLYPGGYSLGSEFDWSNPTSANLPLTPGGTVTPATFITAWLQYFAFETDIGSKGVTDEPFTKAYFDKLEKLAPFWDATDPDLQPFEKAGGKLILWQGEADWSIPTVTSIAYYQAVLQAMGGLTATQRFARYYLLPGVGHCGGNGPDTYNGLGAVVAWTERHVAPQALVATEYAPSTSSSPPPSSPASDLTDAVPPLGGPATTAEVRQLPLFPYPELPAYKGYGNVGDASSYMGRVSQALQQPTPWLGKFDTTMIWCNNKGLDCRAT